MKRKQADELFSCKHEPFFMEKGMMIQRVESMYHTVKQGPLYFWIRESFPGTKTRLRAKYILHPESQENW